MGSIRLTGLATGIDTESMIKELMKAERTKVDKVKQEKQLLQWKQELYTSINKDFANFILSIRKEFGLNVSTTTGSIDSRSLSSLTWVKKAVSSNENAVKASTTSQAVNGSHEITVHRLADGVKAASSTDISKEIKELLSSLGTKVSDEDGNEKEMPDSFSFTINGKLITVNKDDTMSSIVKKINNSGAGVQASYDENIGRFFIQTKDTGETAKLSFSYKYEVKKNSEVKNDSEAKDSDGNTIATTNADEYETIVDEIGKRFLETLNLKITAYHEVESSDTSKSKVWEQYSEALNLDKEYTGVNALITFNGAESITKSSNQFTINGINLDLRQANPNEKITIKVDTDVDAVYDKIKSFVDKYNELVDKIGKLLSEKKYSDYSPLTDEQKEEMTEKQIELWEEKAKSGLLRNDTILSSIMQNIRSSLYLKVDALENSSLNSLYQLGIETEKYSVGTVGGKLEINEEKLREMIAQDVDGVLEVLFSEAKTTIVDGKTVPVKKSGGVITRIFNHMIDGMGEVLAKAGPGDDASLYRNINTRLMIDFVTKYSSISMLDRDITDINKRINDLNMLLNERENRYYSQFSAMETLIQRFNNQGSWLSQQLGL